MPGHGGGAAGRDARARLRLAIGGGVAGPLPANRRSAGGRRDRGTAGGPPAERRTAGFQRIDEARAVGEIAGLPVVRRPSGGGAIVHGSDLTYAAAVPRGHQWAASPQLLYDALHGAMVALLVEFGLAARLCPGGGDRATAAAGEESFFCFDRRSAGDILVESRDLRSAAAKVMGSAQRRLAGVVLQHGSLLLRGNPAVTGRAHHAGLSDMPGFAADLSDRRLLPRRWLERVADDLGVRLVEEETFSSVAPDELESLTGRFLDPSWNDRR